MRKENIPAITQERVRQQRQWQVLIPGFILIVLGMTLICATWYFIAGPGSVRATFDYSFNNVAYEQQLHAIHEMSGNRLESIPLLPQDGSQPRITLAEDFYDFGRVGFADVVRQDFVMINHGEAPLTISRAYTT